MTRREPPRRKQARALLLRHGYAVGGHVKEAIADAVQAHERHDHKGRPLTRLKRGGNAAGSAPGARADKPRRAAGGRNRGTKIIIVNGHPQTAPLPRPVPVPRPMPVPMRPAAPPMAPMRPPFAPPSPALRGTPPMTAKGGGRVTPPPMSAGAKSAPGRLQKLRHLAEP